MENETQIFEDWWRSIGRNPFDPASDAAEIAFKAGVQSKIDISGLMQFIAFKVIEHERKRLSDILVKYDTPLSLNESIFRNVAATDDLEETVTKMFPPTKGPI
jgi:hypothetical protein